MEAQSETRLAKLIVLKLAPQALSQYGLGQTIAQPSGAT